MKELSTRHPIRLIGLVIGCTMLSACLMQPQKPTEEQLAQQQKIMEMIMNRAQQAQQAQQQPSNQPQPVAMPTISDEELVAKISALPKSTGGVKFERRKDGISINGNMFVDAEGAIGLYGYDYATGDMTYLVDNGNNNHVIKYTRALTNAEPVILGTAKRDNAGWTVQTVTGKKMTGDRLFPTSSGLVVAREATVFNFTPGNGIKNFSMPQGFHVAQYQNGDVATTGYMLLERDEEDNKSEGLFGAMKALGSSLGINKKEDYMLVNIGSGTSYPLDISLEGKTVSVGSNCKKKNKFVNECKEMNQYESLYDQNGMMNSSHYFWRVTWMNSGKGPILIALEGGRNITATNLQSGKKVLAFSRALGISEFSATQNADGIVRLIAQMGFTKETIEDVGSFLETAPGMPVETKG